MEKKMENEMETGIIYSSKDGHGSTRKITWRFCDLLLHPDACFRAMSTLSGLSYDQVLMVCRPERHHNGQNG